MASGGNSEGILYIRWAKNTPPPFSRWLLVDEFHTLGSSIISGCGNGPLSMEYFWVSYPFMGINRVSLLKSAIIFM